MWTTSDPAILITGFPGFIAGRLVRRLVALRPDAIFYLLVQPRFAVAAQQSCETIEAEQPAFKARWRVIPGDICQPGLEIAATQAKEIRAQVSEVWHLAAVYDLAVAQSLAYAVNVDGTENVLDFCETLGKLRRLQYISTCYVAGIRTGRVYEDELAKGQEFHNHYESTKHWAEVKVRRRMERLPTSIFRPAVVVGDSKTGETVKGDGPYVALQLMMKLPRWLPLPRFGPCQAHVNLVPVDFVVEAMARLSGLDAAAGRTFALADPTPLTATELLKLSVKLLGRAPIVGQVPAEWLDAASAWRSLRVWTGVPRQSLAYFNHEITFDVSNTAELLGDGLHCPQLPDYWSTLIDYARAHPDIFIEVH